MNEYDAWKIMELETDNRIRAGHEMTAGSHSIIWDSFKVTAVSSMQVLIFIVLYEAAVEIYISNVGPMNKIFGFGMQLDNGTYLLTILAGLNTLGQVFLEKLSLRFAAALLCAALWISYWGNIADDVPNRFILLSVLGMFSFFSGVLLSSRDRPVLR